MKYKILITAHTKGDMVTIFEETISFNIMIHEDAFLDVIKQIMPTIEWKYDDGEIGTGSTYCQYVHYLDKSDNEQYLLASFTEMDEKGFVKL